MNPFDSVIGQHAQGDVPGWERERTTGEDHARWALTSTLRPWRTVRPWQRMWRVLSIDGGGIRGVVPATLLRRMELQTGRPISDLFDIIVGTSTGGLLAMGLTCPAGGAGWQGAIQRPKYCAEDILNIYRKEGARIFGQGRRYRMRSLFGYRRPKYPVDALQRVLGGLFGEAQLRDAIRHTLITTYDSEKRTPYPLNSSTHVHPDDTYLSRGRGADLSMVDVARATSAAPTFFAPHRLSFNGHPLSALDGGVAANNPSLYGMLEAQARVGDTSMLLVSLGTGEAPEQFAYERIKSWGALQWLRPVIELLGSAGSDTTHQQLNFLMNGILPVLGDDQYQTEIEAKRPRNGREPYDVNRQGGGGRDRWTKYMRFQPRLVRAAPEMDNVSRQNIANLEADTTDFLDAAPIRDDFALLCDFLKATAELWPVSDPDWGDKDPRHALINAPRPLPPGYETTWERLPVGY